jgi:hypothetical protein
MGPIGAGIFIHNADIRFDLTRAQPAAADLNSFEVEAN